MNTENPVCLLWRFLTVFSALFCVCNLRAVAADVTLESPCPNVLTYLPLGAADEGTWTAEIHLASEDDLQGVWLHVVLDRKAHTLMNWFGESTTLDNMEYAIRKPEYKLTAGPSVVVKIRATYNAADVPPLVKRLRLNGRTICADDTPTRTTEVPKPYVSMTKNPAKNQHQDGDADEEIDDGLIVSSTIATRLVTPSLISGTTSRGTTTSTSTARTTQVSEEEKYSQEDFFGGDLAHIFAQGKGRGGSRGRSGPRLGPDVDVPCGVPVKRVVPLITHGRPSVEGAWPWHIAIYTLNILQLRYICGGSLLTRHHVLTAAHCVARPRSNKPADADAFLLHLGRTQLTRFNRGLQQLQVDAILIHPLYNHSNYRNDVAILTLAAPADFTDYVRPICLTSDALQRDLTKEMGTVVGWGFDQHNNITELLQETEMPVVDLLTCIFSEPEVYSKLASMNNFCAGFKNGTSVCNGDSGGGMFFERVAPEGERGGEDGMRWELRGMVSFSVASRNDLCNPHAYAVFTDVLKYRTWIKQHIKEPRS